MQNSPSIAQRKSDSFLTNGFYEYLQKQKVGYADMIPLFFNIVFFARASCRRFIRRLPE